MREKLPMRCLTSMLVLTIGIAAAMPVWAQKNQASGGGTLPGSNSKDPINIDAAKLDYYDKEQKLVYTGNVVAVQGESCLLAPVLTIFLMPKDQVNSAGTPSSTNNQVRRMEAAGPVTLTQKDQIGTGDSGLYVKADNKVYLNGNVTLTQGPNVTKGDKLVYDLNTSQAVVSGNVRSLFVPSNNEETGSKKIAKCGGSSKVSTPRNDAALKTQ
jgi:lipopolysaccharide export system protein LptA